ncbi:Transposase, IS4 family [Leptospira santarosai]|nr:Transposase, IS4 family [Leptospira santarosai]
MTRWERMWMNRRSAIEPVISHLKHDHNMIRNFLKGREGGIVSMLYSLLPGVISVSSLLEEKIIFERLYFAFFQLRFLILCTFSGTTS